jgi:hypothetical protein
MKFLLRAFLEVLYAIVVFIIADIAGNIVWRLIVDLGSPEHIDRSNDAAIGFAFLFAFVVLVIWIVFRIFRRRKKRAVINV